MLRTQMGLRLETPVRVHTAVTQPSVLQHSAFQGDDMPVHPGLRPWSEPTNLQVVARVAVEGGDGVQVPPEQRPHVHQGADGGLQRSASVCQFMDLAATR